MKLKVRSTKEKCEQQIMEREMTERKGKEERAQRGRENNAKNHR